MARMLKQNAEKLLAPVPEQYAFWSHDGRIMRNLRELAEALDTMSDETFNYHSNDYKKDFGNWVRDVIGDVRLAKDLDKAASRVEAARVVSKRVSALDAKLK